MKLFAALMLTAVVSLSSGALACETSCNNTASQDAEKSQIIDTTPAQTACGNYGCERQEEQDAKSAQTACYTSDCVRPEDEQDAKPAQTACSSNNGCERRDETSAAIATGDSTFSLGGLWRTIRSTWSGGPSACSNNGCE